MKWIYTHCIHMFNQETEGQLWIFSQLLLCILLYWSDPQICIIIIIKKNNMFYSFCFNPLKLLHLSFRKPADLQNLAPGTHPPFITFNGEVKTDVNKIEEFLEDILCPPKWVFSHLCGNTALQWLEHTLRSMLWIRLNRDNSNNLSVHFSVPFDFLSQPVVSTHRPYVPVGDIKQNQILKNHKNLLKQE